MDAFLLAERLGLVVGRDQRLDGRARYARLSTRAGRASLESVFVAEEDRPERSGFAVAHEIGESRAHRVYESLGVDPREAAPSARESVANALAGRLLVPRRWLTGFWRDAEGDLFDLKQVFATASHELIARRALECVRAPLIVTVTDHGRVAWRRWNLSGPTPPRLRLETDCQQYAHETGQPAWGDGRDEPHSAGGAPIERVRCCGRFTNRAGAARSPSRNSSTAIPNGSKRRGAPAAGAMPSNGRQSPQPSNARGSSAWPTGAR